MKTREPTLSDLLRIDAPCSELVHCVLPWCLDDGTYEEAPAIVVRRYENGDYLHVFVDPTSSECNVAPVGRFPHDPTGPRNTWHLQSECKRNAFKP